MLSIVATFLAYLAFSIFRCVVYSKEHTQLRGLCKTFFKISAFLTTNTW